MHDLRTRREQSYQQYNIFLGQKFERKMDSLFNSHLKKLKSQFFGSLLLDYNIYLSKLNLVAKAQNKKKIIKFFYLWHQVVKDIQGER